MEAMKDIIVNTKWNKDHCRFHSVEEMVDYYLKTRVEHNVKFVLQDVVQCNVRYRNYLRENGYEATIGKLKSEAPSLKCIEGAFSVIEQWWEKTEENGGLGNYDIQCYELNDTFTLLGEKFNGLESVRNIVNASEWNKSVGDLYEKLDKYSRMSEEERFPDNRVNKKSSLFAAEIWEPYPCFDSSDSLYENRRFQCYFVRSHKINEEFFKHLHNKSLQNVVKEDIDNSELPMVYYDGDSPVMYVMSE